MRNKPKPEDLQSVGTGLNETTRVSLTVGTWIGLLMPLVGAAIAGTTLYYDLKTEIKSAHESFDRAIQNAWTVPDQREWAHQIRSENVGKISVPNPDNIRRAVRTE